MTTHGLGCRPRNSILIVALLTALSGGAVIPEPELMALHGGNIPAELHE